MGKLKSFIQKNYSPVLSAPTELSDVVSGAKGNVVPCALIDAFSGPAAFFNAQGGLTYANDQGRTLIKTIEENRESARNLSLFIARTLATKSGTETRLSIPPPPRLIDAENHLIPDGEHPHDNGIGRRSFDLFLTPWDGNDGGILLFAHDVTADTNFASALSASRELYKDLLDCSADFAWETDASGSFTYVTKRGAIGYSYQELNGRKATSLFDPEDDLALECACPFLSPAHIDEQEVTLIGKDAKEYTFLISARPTIDKGGTRRGTRGIARDVSDLRTQKAEIESARRRENAVSRVMRAMHAQMDPICVLEAAAAATLEATETFLCCVYRTKNNYFLAQSGYCIEATFGSSRKDPNTFKIRSEIQHLIPHLQQAAAHHLPYTHVLINNWHFLVEFTYHSGEVNGAVAVALPKSTRATCPEEITAALESISEQVGLAIAQVNQTEVLQEMSRKDSLSSLLNRRAFQEEAERSLQNHVRHRRTGAFIYCDLDNFKNVNDEFGHDEGDAVLVAFSKLLKRKVRKGDLIVRFGGDEFGIWLEETSDETPCKKADELLEEIARDTALGAAPHKIGASLGIALFDPKSGETLNTLVRRADQALYKAKAKGKNCWSLAPAPDSREVKMKEVATC